jgi:hypothetical protein
LRAAGEALAIGDGDTWRIMTGLRQSLPPPLLPIGDSLPGRRGAAPPAAQERPPMQTGPAPAGRPAETGGGQLLIGLQATAPAHVEDRKSVV